MDFLKFYEISEKWLLRHVVGADYKHNNNLTNRVRHINRMIGQQEVESIKWLDFEDGLLVFAQHNPNTHKPPSQKLVKNVFNTAMSIFDYAYELELISRNPLTGKRPPKCQPPQKRRALTPTEEELILATPHRLQTSALIMMFAGLRVGELLALQWDDIDLENRTINVNKSVHQICANEYAIKYGTKNSKCRIISIPKILVKKLKIAKDNSCTLTVTTNKNEELHTPSSWKRAWESYVKTLNFAAYTGDRKYTNPHGIPQIISKITPHMLRHTYATLLYDADVDVLTAQKMLGHSHVTTTLAIYTHLNETKKIQSIEKFDKYIVDNFKGNF